MREQRIRPGDRRALAEDLAGSGAGPQRRGQVVVVDPAPQVALDLDVDLHPARVVGMLALEGHDPATARIEEDVMSRARVRLGNVPVAEPREDRAKPGPVGRVDEQVEVGHRTSRGRALRSIVVSSAPLSGITSIPPPQRPARIAASSSCIRSIRRPFSSSCPASHSMT